MKHKTPLQATPAQPTPDSGEELLREAMKNPGVSDLMRVVEQWERLERAASPLRQSMAPKPVAWVSDRADDCNDRG